LKTAPTQWGYIGQVCSIGILGVLAALALIVLHPSPELFAEEFSVA
jgi:hypothetical protein